MGAWVSKIHILSVLSDNYAIRNRKHPSIDVSTFDGLSDEEAITFLETYDFSQGVVTTLSGHKTVVWRVSNDTVVKCLGFDAVRAYEPYTMALVASETSIPVPKVRKTVMWQQSLYLFMEYVEGDDLARIWSSLGLWRKFQVAWTLRGYVAQLRRVPVPEIPGPLDGTGHPMVCLGHFFTDRGDGPFSSYAKLSSWFASKRRVVIALGKQIAASRNKEYSPLRVRFDDTLPLVLTHGDIALQNVRLGRDGTLWLLDWGRSGVYPQWFEYSAMMAYDDYFKTTPRSWLWLAPFIAGWYKSQNEFRIALTLALDHFGYEDPGEEIEK